MLAGNLNNAVISGLYDRMTAAARAIREGNLGKGAKEAQLATLRSARRDLRLPELPSYNSPEFGKALDAILV